jgi:hypothetical protein
MIEILVMYILPNFALFGGIYLLSKMIEQKVWTFIDKYEETDGCFGLIFKTKE